MSTDTDARTSLLSYWHAVQTFGGEATDEVLADPVWSERFPAVTEGIGSTDVRIKNTTLLPMEVLTAIAGRDDCLYDFHADPDGIRLYVSHRGQPPSLPFEVRDAVLLPREEALRRYGPSCLYHAAELGVGRKGE
jgi:hypothetical protein